jgi:hypothetical protein
MEQLGSHWTDFYEILYLDVFRKYVDKIKFSLNSENKNGTLHEDLCAFMIICRSDLLRMRNVSGRFVEKIRPQILCSKITFLEKSSRL